MKRWAVLLALVGTCWGQIENPVTREELGLGATWLTNTNVTNFRTDIGLGVTNSPVFSNLTVSGTLTAAGIATSAAIKWTYDAVQTSASTNGVLDLAVTGNVLRITNANVISAVINGALGNVFWLVNQSGTNLVISNSATITTRGATNLSLGANQSATFIVTTATNVSAH